ncbi:hypothetical protein DPMN_168543 [Dreissena polymorpha]|uniref:Uncharacterized protein n=1 Tax=Dreissena polymorpha TaxID=45954 RepID=A0A9D4F0V2_DREPO|nr:hypothetical protein DPMN_168543 [Dreissena polymorpha]
MQCVIRRYASYLELWKAPYPLNALTKEFARIRHNNMKAVTLIVGVTLLMCLLDSVQGVSTPSNGSALTTAAPSTGLVATTAANGTQGGNSGSQRFSFTPFSVFIMAVFFATANIALA